MITEEQFEDYKKRLKEEHLRDLIELKKYSKKNDVIWVNAKIERLKKEIDNISIHIPHVQRLGESGSTPHKSNPADNEPEGNTVASTHLEQKTGSSNLCKNCGKTESEHFGILEFCYKDHRRSSGWDKFEPKGERA